MGDGTTISWTDATWNVTRGCRRVSPGCQNCYAERQANRFAGPGGAYEGLIRLVPKRQIKVVNGEATAVVRTVHEPRWTGATKFVTEHLADPLRWKKPRRIFVDSMSDLFYEGFTDEQIAAVFGVMLVAAQHTYQVLTKRPERMSTFFKLWSADDCIEAMARTQLPNGHSLPGPKQWNRPARRDWYEVETWPAPWIWLGTSVENQAAADERIPHLLETIASVRFLSCEPLLGPVDISEYFDPCSVPCGEKPWPDLHWVIAGCESGPGARRCNVEWLRSLRDQCSAAEVPFFLKQAEESTDLGDDRLLDIGDDDSVAFDDGSKLKARRPGGHHIVELPYLDGVQHAAFPEVA